MSQEKYSEAEHYLGGAVELKRDSTEALHCLVWCYQKQGRIQEAQEIATRIRRIDPLDTEAQRILESIMVDLEASTEVQRFRQRLQHSDGTNAQSLPPHGTEAVGVATSSDARPPYASADAADLGHRRSSDAPYPLDPKPPSGGERASFAAVRQSQPDKDPSHIMTPVAQDPVAYSAAGPSQEEAPPTFVPQAA